MKKTVLMLTGVLMMSSGAHAAPTQAAGVDLKAELKKFAPVKIEVDGKLLNSRQKKLVDELVAAARDIDEIFLRQVYDGNVKLREELKNAGALAADLYEYFNINFGPYDRINGMRPFVAGVPKRPAGAAFYPADITKAEFESWVKKHPEDKAAFESSFTVIRRKGADLVAIPYSEEYGDLLKNVAAHMKKAAKHADNDTLKKYLNSRADALLSNDYYASDVDWVHLKDHAIEVVIGPYEVYDDELFGYKAAFEAVITRVDPVESKRLEVIGNSRADLEKHLPIPDEYKGLGRNLESPIVVVQEIYTAGDARDGVQSFAFNLPNDEKVRNDEGSKNVLLKNVQHAKFDKILRPIAGLVMKPEDGNNAGFESFFAHALLHEISHGIGPGEITRNGVKTDVNKELKELYTTIEECKADTLGVYNQVYLIGKGLYPKELMNSVWPTYLAGMFRSVRFGINDAHGGGTAIQFNYLLDKGGFTYDPATGLFGINKDKIEGAVRDLAREVLMIEALGDYKAAKNFIARYRNVRPEMQKALDRLNAVPVDIKPVFAYK